MELKNVFLNGDCFDILPAIPDKSIDLILCDLPYGTTECSWDTVLPLDKLWEQYKRILTDKGAVVLTSSQPFTTTLINSNPDWFKYNLIWKKSKVTGFLNAKNKPLKNFEEILVFSPATTANGSKNKMTYNPQGVIRVDEEKTVKGRNRGSHLGARDNQIGRTYKKEYTNYPQSIISFQNESNTTHPTQKPTALFEYLIKTYSNSGATVLDNCAGVATTAIASINTGRNYICIEQVHEYWEKGCVRISEAEVELFKQTS